MVIENPWTGLREWTAARLALGRCGHSLPTRELLAFQLAQRMRAPGMRCISLLWSLG